MKKLLTTLVLLPALAGLAQASAITVFDTLSGTNDIPAWVQQPGFYQIVGASFSTLNPTFMLDDVKLTLSLDGAPIGTVQANLWTDGGGPGPAAFMASLGTIADTSLTGTPADYDFPVAPIALSPGRYWIVLSSFDSSAAAWELTSSVSGIGVPGEFWGDTLDTFTLPSSGVDFKMQVNGTGEVVPEPATILLGGLGLALLAAYRRRITS